MRSPGAQRTESERGQASVEFLGTLPAALLVVLVAWQLALAGHSAWLLGNAARVGARAGAVGKAPAPAARGALPHYLRENAQVVTGRGRIEVRSRVPFLWKRWELPLRIGAVAAMERQR
jgi:pilus assembly protein CpaE